MTRRRSAFAASVMARHAGHPDDAAAILATVRGPRARSGGELAARHGDELERWLDAQHQRAIARGLLCRMRHVGPPTKRTGPGGTELVVVGTGPADFQGQLPGGRSVALEAKSREGRLGLHELPEHQREDLDACAAGGGLAVLVARLGGAIHAIPWRAVPWASPRGGRPSIGAADVSAWRVDPRCELHPLDSHWSFYLSRLIGGA